MLKISLVLDGFYFVRSYFLITVLLCTNVGSAQTYFEDVSAAAGVVVQHQLYGVELGTGQAWMDVNNDGFEDLVLSNQNGDNYLYVNSQNGSFIELNQYDGIKLPLSHDFGVSITDYNNDGFQDVFISSYGQNKLLKNVAGSAFEDVSLLMGLEEDSYSIAATWADINNDGWLDLYVLNYSVENDLDEADRLYLNNQGLNFIDITADLMPLSHLAKHGLAVQFVDYDLDGDMDLYVVNDKLEQNTLWRNDGSATDSCGLYVCFTDVSVLTQTNRAVWGMGIAIADYDLDGDFDFYFSSIGEQVLLQSQVSQGSTIFIEQSNHSGLNFNAVGWATVFIDINNDQFNDAYLATANTTANKSDRVYINNQNGQFIDESINSGITDLLSTIGAAKGDYNNDGKVDLVVGNWGENYLLYQNTAVNNNHWVKVKLVGGDDINQLAIGSRVTVTTTDGKELVDYVVSGGSHGAGNSLVLHFGMGSASIEDIKVKWPNGVDSHYTQMAVNTQHVLSYPGQIIFENSFD